MTDFSAFEDEPLCLSVQILKKEYSWKGQTTQGVTYLPLKIIY